MPHSAHQLRPRPLAVAIGALALTLTGCSTPADSAPTPPPTTARPTATAPSQATPTTTAAAGPTSPAPTSVNPKIPAEATWDVVERFFAAYTRSLHTGDASQLKELSTEDCKLCANLVEDVGESKARDAVSTGGKITFQTARELKSSHQGRFVWRINYTRAPITFEYPNPEDSYTTEPHSAVFYIELTRVGSDWRISAISDETDPS